jgi:Flagellar hook-length control protein FliK
MDRTDPLPQKASQPPVAPVSSSQAIPAGAGNSAPGHASAASGDATPTGSVPVRELPVAPGQVLQATVAALEDGVLWLGWRGSLFAARTNLPLVPGQSYDFVVTATEPHVMLSTVGANNQPPAAAALVAASHPGPAPSEWLAPLQDLLARLLAVPQGGLANAHDRAALAGFARALQAVNNGAFTAADLQALQQGLGHDQEARVLRLAMMPAERLDQEVASLQTTRKAAALLQLLGDPAQNQRQQKVHDVAQALVTGLNHIEAENATRAEQGAPLWLPLPANPAAGLRDARLFLLPPGEEGKQGGDAAPAADVFTVVLLLDLSRLGALRVDVTLRGDRVHASFLAVESTTVEKLTPALATLREALTGAGLLVDGLQVRRVAGRLPVADLAVRPRTSNALVDVHA